MNSFGSKVLSSYERGILKGSKKSKADEITEACITRATVNRFLSCKITDELPDGTSVTATAEDFIVAAAIGDAIEKGSMDKVLTLMKVKGEVDPTQNTVIVSKVDEDLMKRALK